MVKIGGNSEVCTPSARRRSQGGTSIDEGKAERLTEISQGPEAGRQWESFWAAGPAAGAALTGVRSVAFLDGWWRQEIAPFAAVGRRLRAADLACGGGMLANIASVFFEERHAPLTDLICVDISESAVRSAATRLNANAIVANLMRLPVADASVDIVLSQYGVEYAGDPGIAEAARIVAPGGALLALLHDRDGALAAECRENLALFDDFASSRAFEVAALTFRLAFMADRGEGDGDALKKAFARMRKAMARFDEIIARRNDTIAMEFLRVVRRDLVIMLNRRRAYDELDVERWLGNISREFSASRSRFAAMLGAARAKPDLDRLAQRLAEEGVTVEPHMQVTLPSGASIGWRLLARRR